MEEVTVMKLIECVENEKALYDKRNAFYFNNQRREQIWQQIGKECRISDVECKHRWKLLRERFVKEKKKREALSGLGQDSEHEWKFYRPMKFLENVITPRRTLNSDTKEMEFTAVTGYDSNSSSYLEESFLETEIKEENKLDIHTISENFNGSIPPIRNNLIAETTEPRADEAFMQMVLQLMKDLPIEMKDKFQSEVFQKLYQLRAENRK